MGTSQRTINQVRSILSKLDQTRSANRGSPPAAATPRPGDAVATHDDPHALDADTLIGAPKASPMPAVAPAPSAQDPNRPGAAFGRAKPIPFRGS